MKIKVLIIVGGNLLIMEEKTLYYTIACEGGTKLYVTKCSTYQRESLQKRKSSQINNKKQKRKRVLSLEN